MNTEKKAPNSPIAPIVRVAHIDDDVIFLRCVKDTLELKKNIEVVGQFASATLFLKELVNLPPFDVLIIDYIMPEMNGSELLSELRHRNIKAPIISFSSHSFPEYARQLQKEGIRHNLSKNQLKSLEAMVIKCAGQSSKFRSQQRKSNDLTPDDIEMLMLCCNSYSREQMADKLCIGVDAVKIRKSLLSKKIGVPNDNMEILKWAIRNGYYEA